MVEAGKIIDIATTAEKHTYCAPETPTFREFGYDIVYCYFNALMAPVGTADDVVEKLNSVAQELELDEIFLERARDVGLGPYHAGPEEGTAFIRDFMETLSLILAEVKSQM